MRTGLSGSIVVVVVNLLKNDQRLYRFHYLSQIEVVSSGLLQSVIAK